MVDGEDQHSEGRGRHLKASEWIEGSVYSLLKKGKTKRDYYSLILVLIIIVLIIIILYVDRPKDSGGYISGSIQVSFYQNVTLENATELVESYDCQIGEIRTPEDTRYWYAYVTLPEGADEEKYISIFEQSSLVRDARRIQGV